MRPTVLVKLFLSFSLAVLLAFPSPALAGKTWRCAPSETYARLTPRDPGKRAKILPPAEELHIPAAKDGDLASYLRKKKLRIGTYNTLNLKTFVGSFKPNPRTGTRSQVKPDAPKRPEDRAALADTIRKIDYDVVVLQEVETRSGKER